MSIFKDAYQEWLENLETTMKPELSRKENIDLQMIRLGECFDNQFEEEEVPEPDHEDDGEALASSGFGTDEDYNYYGEDSLN